MISASDAEIVELANSAARSVRDGRYDDAENLWSQVLSLSPDHTGALRYLGQRKLQRGDVRGARAMLEHAINLKPADAALWLNLSFVHRAIGNFAEENAAIQRALEADPYNLLALLAKGALLERQGRVRQAARAYKDALSVAQAKERVEPAMQPALARAKDCVRRNSETLEKFLGQRSQKIRARFDTENLARFDECLGIAAETKKLYRNEMTGLHFPQLPAIGFYDETQFSWLGRLAGATDTIREELVEVLEKDAAGFGAYVQHPPGAPLNQWSELNYSPRWSAYFLWQDGKRNDAHCAQCPSTAALLESLPMANIPGFAPAAFFSVLSPHTRIPAHTGVTNVRLIVHTPLVVPKGCGFRVGNQTRPWEIDRPLVFDDTIEHEAWNDSDRSRVVLIFDIWNPGLTAAERELVCDLLHNMREYYDE